MKNIILVIAIALCSSACGQDFYNQFEISIDPTMRHVTVSAKLERKGDYLTMDWEAADFLPDGWATYVKNMKASTPSGKAVKLTYERPGRWLMDAKTEAKQVHIDYQIVIGHDSIEWEEGGHDESAYVLKDLLFFIGRAMFVTAGQRPELPDENQYLITFKDLPKNYKVTSIWEERGNGQWLAHGTHELIGSLVLVGDQITKRVERGGAEVVLASAPDYLEGLETFATVFEPLLETAQYFFGNLDESKFVLAANVAPATMDPYFSGGVLHRSISIISPFIPDESVLPMVQYILYHEYLHVYGIAMNIEPEETYSTYWFSEGVHDYMSSLLLVASGRMSNEELLTSAQGLSGNWTRYAEIQSPMNIREAGSKKFDNYDLIYSGGHILGAIMDITFIEQSDGQYDLLKYLKEVLDMGEAKKRLNQTVKFNDLRGLAVKNGGQSMEIIFDQYIDGNQRIDFENYLAVVGLKLSKDEEGNPLVEIDDKAEARAEQLRGKFLNRKSF